VLEFGVACCSSRGKASTYLAGMNLDISKLLIIVSGNDDINRLNGAAEGLVKLLSRELELKQSTVNLVHHKTGLDTLTDGLAKDSLGLDAHSVDGIDDNEGSISHTEGSSDLRGEVNVTRGVNKVDQITISGDLNVLVGVDGVGKLLIHGSLVFFTHSLGGSNILGGLVILKEHTDASRLDSDSTLGLIGASVSVAGTSGSLGGDDTSLLDEGVRKGGLSVIDVGNHTHGPDVVLQVHDGTHLVYGKVHLR